MKTLIIIPVFNESNNIDKVIKDINKYSFDYLIINDCSTDNTSQILDGNKYNHLDLPINIGIGGVTTIGFKYARDQKYDCVVCIDGDGQHDPAYVISFIKEIENGNDYVLGSRFVEHKKPFSLRMLGSNIISLLIKFKTGKTIKDPTSGMRALGKRTIELLADNTSFYAEPDTICYLLKHGLKVKEVQVEMKERQGGKSYFMNPFKSISFMLHVIISIIILK